MLLRVAVSLVTMVFLIDAAHTVSAQPAATSNTPTFELSAGYQWLHAPDQTFPVGVNVDGVRHFGPLGLVGEIGWTRRSDDAFGFDSTTNMWNFSAGPRWTGFNSGRVWPYAQVLGGLAVADGSVSFAGVSAGDTESSFLLQPGAGLTYLAGDGWGLFGQVDYRRTFFDEPDDVDSSINNQFRFVVGVRMILD